MELINSPFFIGEDKELVLQLLNTNHVQATEIIDNNHASYPVVGRKFGHHSGKDIKILYTKEQTYEESLDFYTKLYIIEEEYKLEVRGLHVVKIEKAIVHHVQNNEIPIRTEHYGWKWENCAAELPEECLQLAIRAAYVIGIQHAVVKIGRLKDEKVIVLDIHRFPGQEGEQEEVPQGSFTMGADIEFMLSCDDELLPASEFFPLSGAVGCDERQIEQDSGEFALAEIRPEPTESPDELFRKIQKLISDASNMLPYQNVSVRAGSMPFYGYQCGGHLHFGIKPSVKLLRVLDYYLAIPIAMLEQSSTSRRRRKTKHGGLGRFRNKPYGFEYLSLSSWIIKPEITLAVLYLAKLAVTHFKELETPYLYHPIIQRAYYGGNHAVLKSIWQDIKTQIKEKTDYLPYETGLIPLFQLIEEGYLLNETKDIRRNWNLDIPDQRYERGLNIYIPKHIRERFQLITGKETFVCAGKLISKATIHPYPFTFRHSHMINLSPKLRQNLALPKDWNPKMVAAHGALILGPIIGILADRPFERQATYFQHISKIASEKQMLVYVFEPQDILWDKQLIKGTTTEGEALFPFPAVIYDRYFLSRKIQRKEMDEIRTKLECIYRIPFINPPSLFELTGNKWLSYQVLMEEHAEFMPHTRIYQQPEDIKEMLNQYGEIFIKPLSGALGKGIIRVMQNDLGMHWMDSKQQKFQHFAAIENLTELLYPGLQSNAYVLQEAIKRKKFNGKYVEIRVYMQKNGFLKWVRTGMVARLTNEGVLTAESETNKRASIIFNHLYPNSNERKKIKNQIAKVARSAVETIEKEVGTFGELAVDICIDQYDGIKILEVNSKPDNLFSQIHAYKLRNLAALRLLNYATALSGFEWIDNEEGDVM